MDRVPLLPFSENEVLCTPSARHCSHSLCVFRRGSSCNSAFDLNEYNLQRITALHAGRWFAMIFANRQKIDDARGLSSCGAIKSHELGCVADRAGEFDRLRPMRRDRPAMFKGRHFEPQMIMLCVRRYLRFCLSYRDVEELMAERNLLVDHVTIWRWVQRIRTRTEPSLPAGTAQYEPIVAVR